MLPVSTRTAAAAAAAAAAATIVSQKRQDGVYLYKNAVQ